MKADLTTPAGKQICAKFDAALKKANWPAEKLFTRDDVKSFMASAARQSLENVVAWLNTGVSVERIEEEITRLISQEQVVMAKPVQTFEDWMRELRAVAIEYGFREGCHAMCSFELDAPETDEWRLFYNDGYTAREALDEDLRHG